MVQNAGQTETPRELFLHVKTGNIYELWTRVIHCTNGREHETLVIYARQGSPVPQFARESNEFFEKFKPC
jgi:hypothetical protein